MTVGGGAFFYAYLMSDNNGTVCGVCRPLSHQEWSPIPPTDVRARRQWTLRGVGDPAQTLTRSLENLWNLRV